MLMAAIEVLSQAGMALLLPDKRLPRRYGLQPLAHDACRALQVCLSKPSQRSCALQGKYDGMTFWEQLDDGVQNTNNRKFLTLVPVVLFLLATHGTDYR